jgi:hypothetical protein
MPRMTTRAPGRYDGEPVRARADVDQARREAVGESRMVVLRPTRKLRAILPTSDAVGVSTGALGDWYVNRLVYGHQPLLLLVSAASLLPIVVPAKNARDLPARLADVVALRLVRLGIAASLIESERREMMAVQIASANDRSVIGTMVDFAKGIPYYLEAGWKDDDLRAVEDRLAETPCHAGKRQDLVVFPDRKARELLAARWAGGTVD